MCTSNDIINLSLEVSCCIKTFKPDELNRPLILGVSSPKYFDDVQSRPGFKNKIPGTIRETFGKNGSVNLISPLGNDKLMYAIRANSALLVAPDGQFPTVVSFNKFYNKEVYIDFWLEFMASEVPVYIYHFSPNLLANAKDCQFVKATAFSKAFTLGKLYFAIMMENSRSQAMNNQNVLAEYISIYGRGTSISSALKDLFPMADRNTIAYMTRNIGTLLQSGFGVKSLEFANWRESILQEIESRPNMRGEAYRYGVYTARYIYFY